MTNRNAVIILIFVLLFVLTGLYISMENSKTHYEFSPGYNLTEEQKSEVIDIALQNSTVKHEIGNESYIINHVYVNEQPINFTGTSVEYLPIVAMIIGDPLKPGINIFVGVDLNNETVHILRSYRKPMPYLDA